MLRATEEERLEYPQFAALLDSLSTKLDPVTLVPRAMQEEVNKAKASLSDRRLAWLEQLVLYECVAGLVESHDGDAEALDALERLLAIAEARERLGNDETLFGVKESALGGEDLERNRQEIALIQRTLLPVVERRLQEKLDSLVTFATGDAVPLRASNALCVHENALEVKRLQSVIDKESDALGSLYKDLVLLQESVVMGLSDAIQSIKFGKMAERDAVFAQWLIAQADAMAAKMRFLELKFLKDTYSSKEAMSALRKMSAEIEQARQDIAAHRSEMALQKQRFIDAGIQEMQALAKEYAQVQKAIEETQWAMNEIAKK